MRSLRNILSFLIQHPIGKRRKAFVIFRFLKWQIYSRLKLSKPQFRFVENTMLHIFRGQTVATGNYYVGLFEFEEMAFTLHFLRDGDTFFDVGANIGVYSILASGVCKSKSIAFEPIRETFSSLQKNIRLNHLEKEIDAINIGLARKAGVLTFTSDLDAKNHILKDQGPTANSVEIEVRTLDDYIDRQAVLIKIDVEGYELFVLEGAQTILSSSDLKAIIVEVNKEGERYNVDQQSVHNLLVDHGFRLYSYNPFERALIEIKGPTNKDNRIYVRDYPGVIDKLKLSPQYRVLGITF